MFGGAEFFEANFSYGTVTKQSFQGTFSLPLSPDLLTRGEITAFGLERDHSTFASCSEGLIGARALIRVSPHISFLVKYRQT